MIGELSDRCASAHRPFVILVLPDMMYTNRRGAPRASTGTAEAYSRKGRLSLFFLWSFVSRFLSYRASCDFQRSAREDRPVTVNIEAVLYGTSFNCGAPGKSEGIQHLMDIYGSHTLDSSRQLSHTQQCRLAAPDGTIVVGDVRRWTGISLFVKPSRLLCQDPLAGSAFATVGDTRRSV